MSVAVAETAEDSVGDTIWVDVKGREKGDVPRDNSMMLRLKDELDRVSDTLSLPRLSQFYDYSELQSQYGDFVDQPVPDDSAADVIDGEQTGGAWFDPAPALAAVRAIQDHLEKHPEDFSFPADPRRRHWPADLIAELKDCRSRLEVAVSQGRQFRFLIVP